MADQNVTPTGDGANLDEMKNKLGGATLAHCYLATLHRSLLNTLEEMRTFADVALGDPARSTLTGHVSDAINLVYMAEDHAQSAAEAAEVVENSLYQRPVR